MDDLGTIFQDIFNSLMCNVHTCMPGKIISFDKTTQTCSVQPSFMRLYLNSDDPVMLPVIEDVPVLFPGSGNFWMTFDVKKDSFCLLFFTERSLAVWQNDEDDGIVDPQSRRKFDLSDAVAFVGVNNFVTALDPGVDEDAIVLRNLGNTCFVKVENDTITLKNENGDVTLGSDGQVSVNNGNFTVDV